MPMMSWIETTVAAAVTLLFLVSALVMFKERHVDHHPARVYIGASLQGLVVGALIGFVILPLRFAFFVPDPNIVADIPQPPRGGVASLAAIPGFLLLIAVRRGLLARAPLIGPYLRAYRRAALKHQIEGASKALARLEAMDVKKAA